ncbi:serine/threonine-protein kinase [Pseudoalteromonas gelatinilytica]
MSSSQFSQSELELQKGFIEKAKRVFEVIKSVARFKTSDSDVTANELKNTYAYLCQEYNTYIAYQQNCLQLCDFILKWLCEPEQFQQEFNSKDVKVDSFLNNVKVNGQYLKAEIYNFLALLETENVGGTKSTLNWSQQVRVLERHSSDFKLLLADKHLHAFPDLIELDRNVLLLGFLRYCINDGRTILEESFHHSVNNDDAERPDRFSKILTAKNWRESFSNNKKLFNRLILRVCGLHQIEFASLKNSRLKFFAKLDVLDNDLTAFMNDFSDILGIRYYQDQLKVDSDDIVWSWFKKEKFLDLLGLFEKEKVYLQLIELEPESSDFLPLEKQALGTRLGLPFKLDEIDQEKLWMIVGEPNTAYLRVLIDLARLADNFDEFKMLVVKEFEPTFTISTKENKTTKFEEKAKELKQKALEQLLKPSMEMGEGNYNKTQLSQSFFQLFGKSKKQRSSFVNLYLKYVDQTYCLDSDRYQAKAFPSKSDLKILLNDVDEVSFSDSHFAECFSGYLAINSQMGAVVRDLHDYIERDNQSLLIKHSLDAMMESFNQLGNATKTLTEIISLIDEKVSNETFSQNENKDDFISFKDLSGFSTEHTNFIPSDTTFVVVYRLNVLLRLMIHTAISEETPSINALIEQSLQEEFECTYRACFIRQSIFEELSAKNRKKALQGYRTYRDQQIELAKIYVTVKLAISGKPDTDGALLDATKSLAKTYFKTTGKPNDVKALTKMLDKEDNVRKIFSEPFSRIKIHLEQLLYLLEENGSVLSSDFLSKESLGKLFDLGSDDIDSLKYMLLSSNVIESVWNELVTIDDDLFFAVLVSRMLDKTSPKISERNNVPHYFSGSHKNSILKQITNFDYESLLFPATDEQHEVLNTKLDTLEKLRKFNDERFEIQNINPNLSEKLGTGAFGVVYLCRDKLLQTDVAIKLIPTWGDDERIKKKLISEAAIMRQCQGEHVVTVFDLHKFNTRHFEFNNGCVESEIQRLNDDTVFGIVMEYVEGAETLETFSKSKKFDSYNLNEKLELFLQICGGVEQAHNLPSPIIHADIKPSNVLIDKRAGAAVPKLTDFGIASKAGAYLGASSGEVYSSPNILNGGKACIKDDIYSLGMLLLYILYPQIIEAVQNNVSDWEIKEKLIELLFWVVKTEQENIDECKDGYESFILKHLVSKDLPSRLSCFSEVITTLFDYQYKLSDDSLSPIKSILSSLIGNRDISEFDCVDTEARFSSSVAPHGSVREFSFQIGICKSLGVVDTKTVATYGGRVLTLESYNAIPKCDLIKAARLSNYQRPELELFCAIAADTSKQRKRTYLGRLWDFESGSKGKVFGFESPGFVHAEMLERTYIFDMELIAAIKNIHYSEFSVEEFYNLLSKLAIRCQLEEFDPIELPVNLESFLRKCTLTNRLCSKAYSELRICFKALTEQCMSKSFMNGVKVINSLSTGSLKALRQSFEQSNNAEGMLELLVADELHDWNGESVENVVNIVYGDEYGLVGWFLSHGRNMEEWELLIGAMVIAEESSTYISIITQTIEKFLVSEAYEKLAVELKELGCLVNAHKQISDNNVLARLF